MRVCISVGNYATNPYNIPGLEVSVRCIEELCYLLGENAVLLDQNIMKKELVDWINLECGLPELAHELYPIVQRAGSLSGFVCLILEYIGLQDNNYIEDVRHTLKRGAGLSTIERHKKQVDYLVSKKRYASAVRGYMALTDKWETVTLDHSVTLPGITVLASIYHNMGVAYAGMMLYEQAAEAFEKAYSIEKNKEHYMAYLSAKRMGMKENEYIAFAGSLDTFNETQQLEKKMENLKQEWFNQADAKRLEIRRRMRGTEDEAKYFDENDRILKGLKDSYRENVSFFEQ